MTMPYTYDIDPDRRRGVVRLSGTVTGATVTEAMDAMARDERWDPAYDRIWDGRTIDQLVVFPEEFAAFLQARSEGRHLSRRAAIVVVQEHDREVSVLYRRALRTRPIEIFGTIEEAHAWLDDQEQGSDGPGATAA